MTWYVLMVVPMREFAAEKALARMGLKVMIPYESRFRNRRGNVRESRYPLFRGYAFVRFKKLFPWKAIRHLKEDRALIYGVVKSGGEPYAISDRDMYAMKRKSGRKIEPPSDPNALKEGEAVEIVDGPFYGSSMVVAKIRDGIASGDVELFGRQVPAKFDVKQLRRKSPDKLHRQTVTQDMIEAAE